MVKALCPMLLSLYRIFLALQCLGVISLGYFALYKGYQYFPLKKEAWLSSRDSSQSELGRNRGLSYFVQALGILLQTRQRGAKLSSSAWRRFWSSTLLRNFLHTVYVYVLICACQLFLIMSPPSWLLHHFVAEATGDYSVSEWAEGGNGFIWRDSFT